MIWVLLFYQRIRGLEKSLAEAPYALAKRTIYSVLKVL